MAKNRKIVKEEVSINFKLPQELKDKIKELAQGQNKTASKYIRDHFESYINGSLLEDELNIVDDKKFIFSEEFMQLIVWMYSKRVNEVCVEERFELSRYVDVLKKIDNKFPYEIEQDFDKVLQDVIRVKNDRSAVKKFNFINVGLGLNFKRWENYILKGELERSVIYIKP